MANKIAEMDPAQRRTLIGIGAVVLIIVALGLIFRGWRSTQPNVIKNLNLPPGSAPKMAAMRAMKAGQSGNAAGNAAAGNAGAAGATGNGQ